MSLEDTEINVGGTKFKGAHIAVVLAFISTISGGIWATSEFFSRVGVLEDTVAEIQETMPDLAPLEVELEAIKTKNLNFEVLDKYANEKKALQWKVIPFSKCFFPN